MVRTAMADDAEMSIEPHNKEHPREDRFVDVAREEFVVTANAFFAPIVGAVHVVRGLLRDPRRPEREEEHDAT